MNAVRRFIGLFRDSPTYGRDRANLISGFTIGTIGLLLNGAVLLLVLPLMLDPDDRDFRALTENLEFGQLLAVILLGGATAFATLLIPLRLVSVLWGPRIGRYFDQVVLSGISPFRFVIGKVLSQNLFFGLILLLLLPYLVLSLTLGGVRLDYFVAGLFLVWLYCLALALVTMWVSLYLNELLAAVAVIGTATVASVLGCVPLPTQPFVMTPFPALIQPVYASMPFLTGVVVADFLPVFVCCATCLVAVICFASLAIGLGPLYGIIRENSTFGEVVRAGDSHRKRWFRMRLHIQRPSEIAFFYENRSRAFDRHEGLIRWGIGSCGLFLLASAAYAACMFIMSAVMSTRGGARTQWWIADFHIMYLTIHGCGLVLAMIVFSHAKNSTYLRLPLLCGRLAEVSRLDTTCYLLFTWISTAAAIMTPICFEHFFAATGGLTVFPELMFASRGRPVDYFRVASEGSLVISVAGLVVYAVHRLACLTTWTRSLTFAAVANAYFIFVCGLPLFVSMLLVQIQEIRSMAVIADGTAALAMVSPLAVLMFLFNEMGPRFPREVSTAPFYVVHAVLLVVTLIVIRRYGRQLRKMYLAEPAEETR